MTKKKVEKFYPQKHQILGLAQNCIFSAVWFLWFFVHNSIQNHPNWICWGSILLWKKAKNIRKTPKNTWYSAPWLKSSLLNDPVQSIQTSPDFYWIHNCQIKHLYFVAKHVAICYISSVPHILCILPCLLHLTTGIPIPICSWM